MRWASTRTICDFWWRCDTNVNWLSTATRGSRNACQNWLCGSNVEGSWAYRKQNTAWYDWAAAHEQHSRFCWGTEDRNDSFEHKSSFLTSAILLPRFTLRAASCSFSAICFLILKRASCFPKENYCFVIDDSVPPGPFEKSDIFLRYVNSVFCRCWSLMAASASLIFFALTCSSAVYKFAFWSPFRRSIFFSVGFASSVVQVAFVHHTMGTITRKTRSIPYLRSLVHE